MTLTEKEKAKKERIRKLIYNFLTVVDVNSNFSNRDYYEKFFATVSDEDFKKWVSKIGTTLDSTITIKQLPFKEASLEQIKEACENVLHIPLEEYVYQKDIVKGVNVKSKFKAPVGYISIKRMQQLLSKKNKYSVDNTKRNYKYGQVTGDDRIGHMSDNEFYALLTQGANKIIDEIIGPRSDNEKMRQFMYKQISTDGYFSMEYAKAEGATSQNTAMSAWIIYSLASGLVLESSKRSLLSKNYKTDYTVKKEMANKN